MQDRRQPAPDRARFKDPDRAVFETHQYRAEVLPGTDLRVVEIIAGNILDFCRDGFYFRTCPPTPQIDIVRQVILQDAASDAGIFPAPFVVLTITCRDKEVRC